MRARRGDLRTALRRSRAARHGAVTVRRGDGAHVVGYAVGRSVGTAVVRNKVRRRLREIVRTRVPSELVDGTFLVIAGPSSATETFGTLSQNVRACFEELHERSRT